MIWYCDKAWGMFQWDGFLLLLFLGWVPIIRAPYTAVMSLLPSMITLQTCVSGLGICESGTFPPKLATMAPHWWRLVTAYNCVASHMQVTQRLPFTPNHSIKTCVPQWTVVCNLTYPDSLQAIGGKRNGVWVRGYSGLNMRLYTQTTASCPGCLQLFISHTGTWEWGCLISSSSPPQSYQHSSLKLLWCMWGAVWEMQAFTEDWWLRFMLTLMKHTPCVKIHQSSWWRTSHKKCTLTLTRYVMQ